MRALSFLRPSFASLLASRKSCFQCPRYTLVFASSWLCCQLSPLLRRFSATVRSRTHARVFSGFSRCPVHVLLPALCLERTQVPSHPALMSKVCSLTRVRLGTRALTTMILRIHVRSLFLLTEPTASPITSGASGLSSSILPAATRAPLSSPAAPTIRAQEVQVLPIRIFVRRWRLV